MCSYIQLECHFMLCQHSNSMKPEEKIKTYLEESIRLIESAMIYTARDQINYAADEIDLANEKIMQAYAIAREYSDL
jgi:ABC-type dipeptide/oligopeptide/nickel transport system ATPase subunit